MTSDTPPQPTACLLHADIHVMAADCWDTALDYYMQHQGEPERAQRNGYQAAVERRMLNTIRVGNAVDHAVPPSVDRAVRRDHTLCGAHPCSDCR
jgi:hypothetical protein